MVTIVILGLLAAIAIPTYFDFVSDAKKAEAQENLRLIGDGALAYYQSENVDTTSWTYFTKEFPSYTSDCTAGANPQGFKVTPESTDWALWIWEDLNFQIYKPHYFQYCYAPGSTAKSFSARADASLEGTGSVDTRYCMRGFTDTSNADLPITIGAALEVDPSASCGFGNP